MTFAVQESLFTFVGPGLEVLGVLVLGAVVFFGVLADWRCCWTCWSCASFIADSVPDAMITADATSLGRPHWTS